MCGAKSDVRFTPNRDRKSRHVPRQMVMSALSSKADIPTHQKIDLDPSLIKLAADDRALPGHGNASVEFRAPYAVRDLSPAAPTRIHALPNAERRCTGNMRAKQLDAWQGKVDLSIITNAAGPLRHESEYESMCARNHAHRGVEIGDLHE
jgi:hypothetical protein